MVVLLGVLQLQAFAQEEDTVGINKKRLRTVLIGTGTAYGVSLIALNNAWYSDHERDEFHFFNDCGQWNQIDKLGHFYNAYQISRIGKQMFLWTNMPEKKSAIWGAVMSQAMMLPIEILDGFSSEYGFSWCDVFANLAGAGFFLSQELLWQRQLIKTKLSFHTTPYAEERPEVLGETFLQQLLKDYNGHTFWLSFDMHGMLRKNNGFPKWLNPTLGYGADGMVYGTESENNIYGYESNRQYFLSLDFDLSYINTKKKGVRTLLFFVDMIKLPAPTLEFNSNDGMIFHWLYF
jgi:uncharacterized protein YfiM (DUF2279 family)